MAATTHPSSAETDQDTTGAENGTIVDKQYPGWAFLSYGAVVLLILIALISRSLVDDGDPEKIFTTTIFIGTLLGGIGTVYSLARAITKDGWSKDVFILTMQTLGVWVVCIGTAASATFR